MLTTVVRCSGKILADKGSGPFLYLPKLESYREAMLWERIFIYTEKRLGFPRVGRRCLSPRSVSEDQ